MIYCSHSKPPCRNERGFTMNPPGDAHGMQRRHSGAVRSAQQVRRPAMRIRDFHSNPIATKEFKKHVSGRKQIMMIELGREKRQTIRSICEASEEVLVRGAVEGTVGRVWVPKLENSSYCLILVGDYAYLTGLPPKGRLSLELKSQIYQCASHAYLIPQDELWADWIEEEFMGQIRKVSRYALKKSEHHFDMGVLKQYISSIPKGIHMRQLDGPLYRQAFKQPWSHNLCMNFEDENHFIEKGFGYGALKGKELVAGCSACGASEGIVEVQVSTRKDYRRQGLALACSAAFLLECLGKNLIPY